MGRGGGGGEEGGKEEAAEIPAEKVLKRAEWARYPHSEHSFHVFI